MWRFPSPVRCSLQDEPFIHAAHYSEPSYIHKINHEHGGRVQGNMVCRSVNIKNLCTIYCNISAQPYLEGTEITSQKTQFPAHLYNNHHHNFAYQNRPDRRDITRFSLKTTLKFPNVLKKILLGTATDQESSFWLFINSSDLMLQAFINAAMQSVNRARDNGTSECRCQVLWQCAQKPETQSTAQFWQNLLFSFLIVSAT